MNKNILEEAEELKQRLEREKAWWTGRTITLYDIDSYVKEAYKDQYGIPHHAAVVRRKVDVTVVDFAYANGSWGNPPTVMLVVIAADAKGNKYERITDELGGSTYWRGDKCYSWREHFHGLTIMPNGKRVDK